MVELNLSSEGGSPTNEHQCFSHQCLLKPKSINTRCRSKHCFESKLLIQKSEANLFAPDVHHWAWVGRNKLKKGFLDFQRSNVFKTPPSSCKILHLNARKCKLQSFYESVRWRFLESTYQSLIGRFEKFLSEKFFERKTKRSLLFLEPGCPAVETRLIAERKRWFLSDSDSGKLKLSCSFNRCAPIYGDSVLAL